MAKKMKNKSISENIASLLNSAPSGFDQEEDVIDDTTAKVTEGDETDDEFVGINEPSKIRAQNVDLLETLDEKYAGKIGSRKRLRESSESDEQSDEDDGADPSSEETDESEREDEEIEEEESSEEMDQTEDAEFKHFSKVDADNQASKGMCVRNQLSLWESLLETRIQLQKCLVCSNKMPTGDKFEAIRENNPQEFKKKLVDTKKSLGKVLDKMVQLQTMLVQKYPESKKIFTEKKQEEKSGSKSDEEITSEEDEVDESDEEDVKKETKRRNEKEYEELLSKRHELYKKFRNNTIQKWNEKSRIGTLSKNNANTQTILNQIEHILSDKSKLIKKTQMKRSNYSILGESDNEGIETKDYNENIYDDDDFYHQLLKELIEFKSSDVTDPVQLGRQWIQLQNMRSKMKRKIDTRATKGRKIRYAVHSKLVNFMAPIDYRDTWSDEAKKELFNSLFGKKQTS